MSRRSACFKLWHFLLFLLYIQPTAADALQDLSIYVLVPSDSVRLDASAGRRERLSELLRLSV